MQKNIFLFNTMLVLVLILKAKESPATIDKGVYYSENVNDVVDRVVFDQFTSPTLTISQEECVQPPSETSAAAENKTSATSFTSSLGESIS